MVINKKYTFENYKIEEKTDSLFLNCIGGNFNERQRNLFSIMLNFGYIEFNTGVFIICANDIINFWKYANKTILSDYSLNEYYKLFNLSDLYTEKIPTIKTKGAFHSNDFSMTVVWKKADSTMYSQPLAYKQNGLELIDINYEDDVLGSLFTEYIELYSMIDQANHSWNNWKNEERYDFLTNLISFAKEATLNGHDIIISDNLRELEKKE